MANLLEPPIGIGRTAEVFAWEEGTVLKLLRPGFDPAGLEAEAAKTRAASAAGAPAPRVHGLVEVDGRRGLVLDRVNGVSMLTALLGRRRAVWSFGTALADVHGGVLACRPAGLSPIATRLTAAIGRAGLPTPTERRALAAVGDLPTGDALLHGDLHPDNVFGAPDEVVVIDWVDATIGHPAADIARTSWMLSGPAIPPDLPQRHLAVAFSAILRRAYTRRILQVTGVGRADLDGWRLPVLAARIAEGIDHEQPFLHREVERLVRTQG